MLTPRPYQTEAVRQIVEYATENIRGRLLVVCPPGGGKTLMGAMAIRELIVGTGLRAIAWAHRRELVGQMCNHLVECGIPSELVGVAMAGDPRENPSAPIQVASTDTLRRREKPPADLVLSDEAHRDASDGRRRLRALYPDAFHCGLTGTPIRLDGRPLVGPGRDYEHMIVAAQSSELIAEGWLSVPKIITVPKEFLPDLSGVKKRGGDYDIADLEARTNKRFLIGNSVEHWQRHAEGRRTIIYPVGIKHSLSIVARFRAAGIEAEHVDGTTPHRFPSCHPAASSRRVPTCHLGSAS
jgi:DNA repair protein RadD